MTPVLQRNSDSPMLYEDNLTKKMRKTQLLGLHRYPSIFSCLPRMMATSYLVPSATQMWLVVAFPEILCPLDTMNRPLSLRISQTPISFLSQSLIRPPAL